MGRAQARHLRQPHKRHRAFLEMLFEEPHGTIETRRALFLRRRALRMASQAGTKAGLLRLTQ